MATKLTDFISNIGQGVKPNMFSISIQWPNDLGSNATPQESEKDLINVLCKSAALPASNLGVIEVPFRGRTVKIAGDRTFDTWTATFFNDKEMMIRSYFEQWLESMNTHEGNYSPKFVPNQSAGYMCDVIVKQLEKSGDDAQNGKVIREYTLKHAFPTNISQIDLAYASNDQVEEFSCEFQYSYWLVGTPTSSNLDSGAGDVEGTKKFISK